MMGKLNWPSKSGPDQAFNGVPNCEWISDGGAKIWLPGQYMDLVVEFPRRAEGPLSKLAIRSRRFLASVARRLARMTQSSRRRRR
jgi:hypothetical protein